MEEKQTISLVLLHQFESFFSVNAESAKYSFNDIALLATVDRFS